jgi:hypothetical protein
VGNDERERERERERRAISIPPRYLIESGVNPTLHYLEIFLLTERKVFAFNDSCF